MRQSDQNKPLPEIGDLTRPFWSGARAGKLMMQKCAGCGTLNFYPKPWCIECGDRRLAWTAIRPTGTVYSYTTAGLIMMNLSGWSDELPITLCLVDLDEGPRMYAQLIHCAPKDVRIGMRVKADFAAISEEAGIPRFRPE